MYMIIYTHEKYNLNASNENLYKNLAKVLRDSRKHTEGFQFQPDMSKRILIKHDPVALGVAWSCVSMPGYLSFSMESEGKKCSRQKITISYSE